MSTRDSAAEYLSRGWAPIPIPWCSKVPVIPRWPELRITAETLGDYFNGARQNIGVLLGDSSGGLIDIDLDCSEATVAARHLLPDTGCVFGRAGNPVSHLLFLSSCRTRKFADPAGNALVELRGAGCQTIVPPSAHPSGEPIEWTSTTGRPRSRGCA